MAMTPFNGDLTQALKWMQNNAPNIQALINQKAQWYAKYNDQFWSDWETTVYDLRTANPFGLMVWCVILGVPSQLFGLYPESNAWAFGANRQNFVYSGGATPATDQNTVGGNFAGGGNTTLVNANEVRWALQLRYVSLVSNGNVQFINRMLRYIFNGDAAWNYPSKKYFYLMDSTGISNGLTNVSIYRNDWQGNQLMYASARTNSVLQSQTFDNASWTKTRATVTANATTAPDGTLTADKVVEDTTASNTHCIVASVAVPANAVVKYSVFVKAAERTFACVQLGNFANQVNPQPVYINLSTGQLNVADASRATVTAYPNGWWKVSTSVTAIASSTTVAPSVYTSLTNTGANYTGDGVSGIYVWGAQVEINPLDPVKPSSYIATTTAAVTTTDYTLNATTGAVTFAVAPLTGAALTWTGTWDAYTTPATVQFGTGNGSTTAFTIAQPKGAVVPVASPLQMEYRVGAGMGLSAQFINLLNSPQYGITPSCAGTKYTVIQES